MSSSEPAAPPRVGLVTKDLMIRSRVEAGLGEMAARVEMIVGDRLTGAFDLLLLDLNREAAERLAWLSRVAPTQPGVEVICFGPHTEMAELNPTARAAGASRCVANSHLPETLQRWLRSRGGAPPRPRRATA